MALGKPKKRGNYLGFKAGIGLFAIKSDQSDPEARPRTYKDTKTEQDVTVYEKQFQDISGKLVGIEVDTEGDYGTQVKLTIRDGEDYILSVPVGKSWGQKICEAIPNINLEEDVLFEAYGDYVSRKTGKDVKAGVALTQNKERVESKFKSYDTETKVFTYSEGFPEVDNDKKPEPSQKTKWTKFWGDYFFTVGEFLETYITANNLLEVAVAPVEEEVVEDVDTF